jgi:protein gp37
MARRQQYAGEVLTADRRLWNGRMKFFEERLEQPLRWRKPQVVAVCFMGDIALAEPEDIQRLFEVMESAMRHEFLILTKQPQQLQEALFGESGSYYLGGGDYLPNVWMGVSAGTQTEYYARFGTIAHPQSPSGWWSGPKWASLEPCREPIVLYPHDGSSADAESMADRPCTQRLDWVVAGSADTMRHGAREFSREIARSLRGQCRAAGIPFWLKQAVWNDMVPDASPEVRALTDRLAEARAIEAPHLDGRQRLEAPEPIAAILRAHGKIR